MNAKQLAPLSGVLAVLLIIAAFAVGGETPEANDPLSEVISYYSDHDADLQISAGLLGLGAFFFLLFSTTVAGALRRAPGPSKGAAAFSFAGGIVFAVGATIFAGLGFTAGDVVGDVDPAVVQALNALGADMFFTVAVGTGAFLLGAGVGTLKTGVLPRWLGWAAVVIGVIAITPAGFFGFLALGVWTLVASVMLAMQSGRESDAPPLTEAR
jgi:hypothetical protein